MLCDADDDRFLTVFKKTVKPYIPTRHSGAAVNLQLQISTVQDISQFLDTFPVTKAEQEMNIDRKHNENAHMAYGFGDVRARAKLTVPPAINLLPEFSEVRKNLPIFEYRSSIVSTIQSNQVIVVSGETGSGELML